MRSSWVGLLSLTCAFLVSDCSDGTDRILQPPVTVEATWLATVSESSDTCDAVLPPDFTGTAVVEYDGELETYFVYLTDDASGACWVLGFDRTGDRLSFPTYGLILSSHPCNDGCRVRMELEVSLDFLPGGMFVGMETIRYIPESPECDHPDCGFPCGTAELEHPLAPPSRRPCSTECEATYRWTGRVCENCDIAAALRACI